MERDARQLIDMLRSIADRLRDVASHKTHPPAGDDELTTIAEQLQDLADTCETLAAAGRLPPGAD